MRLVLPALALTVLVCPSGPVSASRWRRVACEAAGACGEIRARLEAAVARRGLASPTTEALTPETFRALVDEGAVPRVPDDPGELEGSAANYVFVAGRVFCLRHGGLTPLLHRSAREQLVFSGVRSAELLAHASQRPPTSSAHQDARDRSEAACPWAHLAVLLTAPLALWRAARFLSVPLASCTYVGAVLVGLCLLAAGPGPGVFGLLHLTLLVLVVPSLAALWLVDRVGNATDPLGLLLDEASRTRLAKHPEVRAAVARSMEGAAASLEWSLLLTATLALVPVTGLWQSPSLSADPWPMVLGLAPTLGGAGFVGHVAGALRFCHGAGRLQDGEPVSDAWRSAFRLAGTLAVGSLGAAVYLPWLRDPAPQAFLAAAMPAAFTGGFLLVRDLTEMGLLRRGGAALCAKLVPSEPVEHRGRSAHASRPAVPAVA